MSIFTATVFRNPPKSDQDFIVPGISQTPKMNPGINLGNIF